MKRKTLPKENIIITDHTLSNINFYSRFSVSFSFSNYFSEIEEPRSQWKRKSDDIMMVTDENNRQARKISSGISLSPIESQITNGK